jgi:hypothetical protein
MRNLKQETLKKLKDIGKRPEDIVALKIVTINETLKATNQKEILNIVENELDFNYDPTCVYLNLQGIILFDDNTWLERVGCENNEWWGYFKPVTVEMVENYPKDFFN